MIEHAHQYYSEAFRENDTPSQNQEVAEFKQHLEERLAELPSRVRVRGWLRVRVRVRVWGRYWIHSIRRRREKKRSFQRNSKCDIDIGIKGQTRILRTETVELRRIDALLMKPSVQGNANVAKMILILIVGPLMMKLFELLRWPMIDVKESGCCWRQIAQIWIVWFHSHGICVQSRWSTAGIGTVEDLLSNDKHLKRLAWKGRSETYLSPVLFPMDMMQSMEI